MGPRGPAEAGTGRGVEGVQGLKYGQLAWVLWVKDRGDARKLWVPSTPQVSLTLCFSPVSGCRGWGRRRERDPAKWTACALPPHSVGTGPETPPLTTPPPEVTLGESSKPTVRLLVRPASASTGSSGSGGKSLGSEVFGFKHGMNIPVNSESQGPREGL